MANSLISPPRLNKRVRLALWWLLYRLPMDVDLDKKTYWTENFWKEKARVHLKLDREAIMVIEASYPRQWQRMLAKRRRRLKYAQDHGGYCPKGWTPPAPGEAIRPLPYAALAARHEFGLMGVIVEYKEGIELDRMAKYGRSL